MRHLGIVLCVGWLSTIAFGSNGLGLFTQAKWVDKAVFPMIGIQYERYLLPMTSAYIQYSGVSLDYSPSDSIRTKSEYSDTAVGLRVGLLFFTLGAGYETLSAKYSNTLVSTSAKIDGVFLEAGKRIKLGPVQMAVFYRLQFADVSTTVKSIGDISIPVSDGPQTVHTIDASASIFF